MSRQFLSIQSALLAAVVGAVQAAEPAPAATREIGHLLSSLEGSSCEFFRNGTWYSGKDARKHLQQKYDYLLKKGMLTTAESFIELGASSSSASGKPYQVRCPGEPAPRTSAAWFAAELEKHRKGGK